MAIELAKFEGVSLCTLSHGMVQALKSDHNSGAGFAVWSTISYMASVIILFLHVTSCERQAVMTCSSAVISFNILMDNNLIDRCHLVIHFVRACTLCVYCLRMRPYLRRDLQAAVSSFRRRYYDDERRIDLDLTYICDRVIAMSLPCVRDCVYRNDISEVSCCHT